MARDDETENPPAGGGGVEDDEFEDGGRTIGGGDPVPAGRAGVYRAPDAVVQMGSVATSPMFIQSVPTPKSSTVSPYGNFLDISSKDQKALWREMVKPADDHVPLDMNVTNSRAIVDLFQDRAITFRWMRFMRVPTNGTGSPRAFASRTPGGKEIYAADLSDFKNLIEDFQHITLEQVMAFASWFMGDYGEFRILRRPGNMKMKYIDVNAPGNPGLVACFKQECRTVSCLVWHTIKNHLTTTSYRALLVRKKDFAYECTETGDIIYEGFTLLRMIYTVVKPNLVVDVKDLQLKMEKMTLLSADNNFHTLATSLEELQQEINAEKGEDFCKDDKLLTELFRAAETTTNELFAINVSLAKTAWITGKTTNKNTIINDLCVLYRNSVADGSWGRVSSADSKIIALTTQVNGLKAQLSKASAANKNAGKPGKQGQKPAGNKDKNDSNKWRYTKVGETAKDPSTGATVKWCPHHGTGAYMPADHNHEEWLVKKKRKTAKFEEGRSAKRVKFSPDTKAATNLHASKKDEKHPSKLQLASSVKQSLVTQCSMTPTEAGDFFESAFNRAMDLN